MKSFRTSTTMTVPLRINARHFRAAHAATVTAKAESNFSAYLVAGVVFVSLFVFFA